MNAFHRLHALRMENDAAKFAMDEQRPRFDRLANRHENGAAPRAVSAYQLFQTPEELAARLLALVDLQPGQSILEPSAGLGRLIRAAGQYGPGKITAVEIATPCAAELFRLDGVTLLQRDFLAVTPADTGSFDAVAMNPPFHLRSDIRHILHALQFLRHGGKLAALCLDTHHREQSLRHLSDTWEKIPAGAFRKEGTGVACVLLSITKK